jgi:hypothetical protein
LSSLVYPLTLLRKLKVNLHNKLTLCICWLSHTYYSLFLLHTSAAHPLCSFTQ